MPPEFRLVRYTGKNNDYYQIEERYWSWWPLSIGWKYGKLRNSLHSGFNYKYTDEEAAKTDFDLLLDRVAKQRSDVLLTIIKVSEETVKPNNYTLADCEPLDTRVTYQYEAMDATGQTIKDEILAFSEEEAQQVIRQMGYFVTKINRKWKR